MLSKTSISTRCPNCREIKSGSSHKCPPKFYVRLDEEVDWFGDNPLSTGYVFASDAQSAAEKFVRQYDVDSDYDIVTTDSEYTALVATQSEYEEAEDLQEESEPDSIDWTNIPHQAFRVTGQYVPSYYVALKKSEQEKAA